MISKEYITESDLLGYIYAKNRVMLDLINSLNDYCRDKSFTFMISDRIKSLKSIKDKIEKKKSDKGNSFDPQVDLLDVAGLRVIFYDRNSDFSYFNNLDSNNENDGNFAEKSLIKVLDKGIHEMSSRDFEIEFEKSKLFDGNYNVYNLYDFVENLARSWDTVIIIKDYIMYQKESGYQSLHVIMNVPVETIDSDNNIITKYCPVEIQFRNYTQHLYNECEHAFYKGCRDDFSEFKDIFESSKRFLLSVSNDTIEEMLSSDKQYLLIRKY